MSSMKSLAIVMIGAGILAVGVGMYASAHNKGNRLETAISAKYKDNENVYAQGAQAVSEIAQVPEMYSKDLLAVVTADIQGRYGKDGSSATMQWIQERQLNLDVSMYRAIQQQILAFRGKFENSQRELLDQCRSYKTQLGNFWEGTMLSMAGYPKIDLKEHCEIVTTEKARQTFDSKRDTGINLRPAR